MHKQVKSFGTSQGKSIFKAYNDFCTCCATSIEKRNDETYRGNIFQKICVTSIFFNFCVESLKSSSANNASSCLFFSVLCFSKNVVSAYYFEACAIHCFV